MLIQIYRHSNVSPRLAVPVHGHDTCGAPPRALGTFAHVQSLPAQGAHMSTKDMIMLREGAVCSRLRDEPGASPTDLSACCVLLTAVCTK